MFLLQLHPTSWHPEGNGLVERSNQTLRSLLDKLTRETEDWDLYLDIAAYTYNTTPREMFHGLSSFELEYGFRPAEFTNWTASTDPDAQWNLENYLNDRKDVQEALERLINEEYAGRIESHFYLAPLSRRIYHQELGFSSIIIQRLSHPEVKPDTGDHLSSLTKEV